MHAVLLSITIAFLRDTVPATSAADTLINDAAVRGFFAELVRRGGNGLLNEERAAFIVRGDAGSFRCLAWPFSVQHRRAHFAGEIPEGTIAVAHTHPLAMPHASVNDRKLAAKLGFPVLVLTPRTIDVLHPDGSSSSSMPGQAAPRRCGSMRAGR